MGMAVIHWVCTILMSRKFPKYCLTASSEGFEYGTIVVRYNSGINASTKGSAAGSISYETRSLR
jgi:hypothetical protein